MTTEDDIRRRREELKEDASARPRRAADPAYSIWVSASAGTGKTKVLTDRVLRLLLAGIAAGKLLCLTYTKAAAVEMNSRVSEKLSQWAVADDDKLEKELKKLFGSLPTDFEEVEKLKTRARKLFALMLDTPGGIKIQTIHSFCQEVLRRFPLEAGISPHFEVMDSRSEREALLQRANAYDLLITSYDYLKRDPDLYQHLYFDTVVLDEAQYISNPRTKNAQCVKQLNCRQRFALSGTPIENTLTELWSIYDFLLPGYLYTHGTFSDLFEKPIVKEKDERATQRLQRLVRPFLLRRTKQEVLQELPDKEEHVLQFHFDQKERELYLANAAGIRQEIENGLNTSRDSIAILALITRLRQLCQDARLVYENADWISSKLQGCMELVRSCIQAGHKILLFSSFTSMLDLIREEMEKEGISCYVLTGSLPKEKRREYVEAFQHDDTPVFMISLKAGGTGLNLTAADVVIHFDPWWNLSAQNQATDRAHRIGQHNNVQVYSLIMKGTIEEKIQELQQKKSDLAQLFVNTQNTNLLRDMSREELLDLFSADV